LQKFLAKSDPVVPFYDPNFEATTSEERMVSQEEIDRRSRQGKFYGFLAVAWWVASIGGIIWVISSNA